MLDVVEDVLEAGATVGRYRLVRIVGQGGMGVVWEAHEGPLDGDGRRVALKFLLSTARDPKARERFLREAKAAMEVKHPNIAAVEAVLETDVGTPYLVMELLVGASMRQRLGARGRLSPFETARLLAPVVAAVGAAHAARIVHRDLKPENVFLLEGREPEAGVRVLDFGIAKRLARGDETASAVLTSTGAVIGTPLYMAPEQVFGDLDIDERADVWSLGIMLYECLAGARPTDGEGFGQIIKRITTAELVPLDAVRPGLPPDLTSLCGRMLAREREARPSLDTVAGVLAAVVARGDAPMLQVTEPLARPLVRATTTGPSAHAPTYAGTTHATYGGAPPPIAAARAAKEGTRNVMTVVFLVLGFVVVPATIAIGIGLYRVTTDPTYNPRIIPGQTLPNLPTPDQAGKVYGLEGGAKVALGFEDGKRCLDKLDERDALARGTTIKLSTNPAEESAQMRARCWMLQGECERGKELARQRLAVVSPPRDEAQRAAIERLVGDDAVKYCPAASLSTGDTLRKNRAAIEDVIAHRRSGLGSTCQTLVAEERRILSQLNVGDREVAGIASSSHDAAFRCFLAVRDCTNALATFRESPRGKAAADVRKAYDLEVARSDCQGKP